MFFFVVVVDFDIWFYSVVCLCENIIWLLQASVCLYSFSDVIVTVSVNKFYTCIQRCAATSIEEYVKSCVFNSLNDAGTHQ